jgi:hypothetical protein
MHLLDARDPVEKAIRFEILTRGEHEAHQKNKRELPGRDSCFREQSDALEQIKLFARHKNIRYLITM